MKNLTLLLLVCIYHTSMMAMEKLAEFKKTINQLQGTLTSIDTKYESINSVDIDSKSDEQIDKEIEQLKQLVKESNNAILSLAQPFAHFRIALAKSSEHQHLGIALDKTLQKAATMDAAAKTMADNVKKEVQKELNQQSSQACAQCSKQKSESQNLLRCSRCKNVYYCSQACQKLDWKKHKSVCKETDKTDSV